jgi:predicted alpha/beta hydrolase family esterase
MGKKVLLLHGWGGSDYPHWQSWLAGEIARDYGCVNFLRFLDAQQPKLQVWMQQLEDTLEDFRPDIVVCHSLANTLWFHLCAQKELREVEKLYLVAPPSLHCSIAELSQFFPLELPKNLYAKEALLITSTNDPYLTQQEAVTLKNRLNIPMEVIQNGGHLNAESGYGKWEWMLKELQNSIKS